MAATVNAVLFLFGTSIFSAPKIEEIPPDNLQEIEWIEIEDTATTAPAPKVSEVENFPEIVLPPLEIPHTVFEPLPKLEVAPPPEIPKVEEIPAEEKPVENESLHEDKKISDPAEKLKVIVKVLPKDIIEQFISSGVSEEKINWNGDKIILAVTIGIDGKVKPKSVEIISGAKGELIDFVAKTAASSWIFEPYLDEDGNPQELKTQIEFGKEDF